METDVTNLFIRKLEYIKLSLEISRYRCQRKDPPIGPLMQTLEAGGLAKIPSEYMDSLLFDIYGSVIGFDVSTNLTYIDVSPLLIYGD